MSETQKSLGIRCSPFRYIVVKRRAAKPRAESEFTADHAGVCQILIDISCIYGVIFGIYHSSLQIVNAFDNTCRSALDIIPRRIILFLFCDFFVGIKLHRIPSFHMARSPIQHHRCRSYSNQSAYILFEGFLAPNACKSGHCGFLCRKSPQRCNPFYFLFHRSTGIHCIRDLRLLCVSYDPHNPVAFLLLS
nr:MAG TPA: hypothetical protein [Caudoviricetes sp.]